MMPPAAKKTLTAIAADMRGALADRNGYRATTLGGGLDLVLSRTGSLWSLTCKRPDVPPSSQEIIICRSAFNVPDEPAVQTFKRQLPSPKTGALITYHGIILSWREYPTVKEAGILKL